MAWNMIDVPSHSKIFNSFRRLPRGLCFREPPLPPESTPRRALDSSGKYKHFVTDEHTLMLVFDQPETLYALIKLIWLTFQWLWIVLCVHQWIVRFVLRHFIALLIGLIGTYTFMRYNKLHRISPCNCVTGLTRKAWTLAEMLSPCSLNVNAWRRLFSGTVAVTLQAGGREKKQNSEKITIAVPKSVWETVLRYNSFW